MPSQSECDHKKNALIDVQPAMVQLITKGNLLKLDSSETGVT